MLAAKNSSNIGEFFELLKVRLADATSTYADFKRSRYRSAMPSTPDSLSCLGSSSNNDDCAKMGCRCPPNIARPPKTRSNRCSAKSAGGTPSVGIIRERSPLTGKSIQQSTFSLHARASTVSQETSVANGSRNTTARSRASKLSQNHDNARLASSFLIRMSRPWIFRSQLLERLATRPYPFL